MVAVSARTAGAERSRASRSSFFTGVLDLFQL
jgi:hypothetical protein